MYLYEELKQSAGPGMIRVMNYALLAEYAVFCSLINLILFGDAGRQRPARSRAKTHNSKLR